MTKAMCFSVVLYILGDIAVTYYLDDINLFYITQKQSETLWQLQFIRDIGFWGFCFFAVVLAFFSYLNDRNKTNLTWLVLVLCGNLAFIGFTLNGSSQLTNIPPITGHLVGDDSDILSKYQDFLNPKHEDLKEHSKVTKMMAAAFFEDNGVIVDVVDENGELVQFKPSAKNLKTRQDILHAEALIKHQADSLKASGMTHILLLIVAVLVGLASPRLNRAIFR